MGRDARSRSSSTARVHSATPEVSDSSGMMLPVWTEIEDDAGAILGNTNRHLQSCEPEYWGFDRTGQPPVPDGKRPIRRLQLAFDPGADHTLPRAGRGTRQERRRERAPARLHGYKITSHTRFSRLTVAT